jgi:hypothetical protein
VREGGAVKRHTAAARARACHICMRARACHICMHASAATRPNELPAGRHHNCVLRAWCHKSSRRFLARISKNFNSPRARAMADLQALLGDDAGDMSGAGGCVCVCRATRALR